MFDDVIDKKKGPQSKSHHKSYVTCHICASYIQKHHINNNGMDRLKSIIKDRIKDVRKFNSKDPTLLGFCLAYCIFLHRYTVLN